MEVFLDAKRPVSFPLGDKHVVNEQHVIRMWCISMYHVIGLKKNSRRQKRHSEDGKKIRRCRGQLGREITFFTDHDIHKDSP